MLYFFFHFSCFFAFYFTHPTHTFKPSLSFAVLFIFKLVVGVVVGVAEVHVLGIDVVEECKGDIGKKGARKNGPDA